MARALEEELVDVLALLFAHRLQGEVVQDEQVDRRQGDAIGWPVLSEALSKAHGRVLVLLDACHAGHVTQELVAPNEALASQMAREGRAGAVIFAAAKGRQNSYEATALRGLSL